MRDPLPDSGLGPDGRYYILSDAYVPAEARTTEDLTGDPNDFTFGMLDALMSGDCYFCDADIDHDHHRLRPEPNGHFVVSVAVVSPLGWDEEVDGPLPFGDAPKVGWGIAPVCDECRARWKETRAAAEGL